MKHPPARSRATGTRASLLVVAAAVLGAVALGTALATGPTAPLPPEKQALEDQAAAWRAEAQANSDPSKKLSDPGQPILTNPTETWPDGVIGNEGAPWSAMDFVESNAWQGWVAGRRVSIYAGSPGNAPKVGVLRYVVEADGGIPGIVTEFKAPTSGGILTIEKADGTTLQIVDQSGTRLSFDALALTWQAQ